MTDCPPPGDTPLIAAIDCLLAIETPAVRALRENALSSAPSGDAAQLPPGGTKPGSAIVRTSRR